MTKSSPNRFEDQFKYEDAQVEAIFNRLTESEEYHYRKICRSVSNELHISYLEVERLPLDKVLRLYYESSIDKMTQKDLVDIALELCAPELAKAKEDQVNEIVRKMAAEQKQKEEEPAPLESLPETHKPPEMNLRFDE